MSQFSFRLSTLLQLRQTERDQRRQALAESCRAEQEVDRQIEAVETLLSEAKQAGAQAAAPGAVRLAELTESQRYQQVLAADRRSLETRRQELIVVSEGRRDELVVADQGVKSLDKLRGRQEAQHLQNAQRANVQEMDETALRPFVAEGQE